jgi:LacI family transcriptional regulator
MAREAVTIKDVARKAGVAISTVSSVINGHQQHVGPVTREKVLLAVKELGYRPNAIARSMVKRTTGTIGLVMTDVVSPLFNEVIIGVAEVMAAEGFQILISTEIGVENEDAAIETFRSKQVDGFIFMSRTQRYTTKGLTPLKKDKIPFVVINRYLADPEINQVLLDDFGNGWTATQHLIRLGHTRIATLCGPLHDALPWRSAVERNRGWQQALEAHGLPANQDWVIESPYTFKGGYQSVQRLLEIIKDSPDRPTALFVANDSMCVGALKALQDAGLRLPQEMAVVGIGDPAHLAYTFPATTTLSLPIIEAGRVAARILVNWIKNGKPEYAQSVTLNSNLIVRESCGAHLSGKFQS